MKTRVLFMILLSAIVISLSSCTRTEKRVVPGTETKDFPDYYVLKTKDGKTLWGLESAEAKDAVQVRKMLIPLEYDSIALSDPKEEIGEYKALKDGLWYVYEGESQYAIPGFTRQKKLNGPAGGLTWKLYTPDGVYGMYSEYGEVYGPYEDVHPGALGYFFKDMGRWGYIIYDAETDQMSELLPAEYEAVIEISNAESSNYGQNYFLVQKNEEWSFFGRPKTISKKAKNAGMLFDRKGRPLKYSPSELVELYNLFPDGENMVFEFAGKKVICVKHLSGFAGVMGDI